AQRERSSVKKRTPPQASTPDGSDVNPNTISAGIRVLDAEIPPTMLTETMQSLTFLELTMSTYRFSEFTMEDNIKNLSKPPRAQDPWRAVHRGQIISLPQDDHLKNPSKVFVDDFNNSAFVGGSRRKTLPAAGRHRFIVALIVLNSFTEERKLRNIRSQL
ncbi:hypothetical protein CF326_g9411, partial [Tilletia indica]